MNHEQWAAHQLAEKLTWTQTCERGTTSQPAETPQLDVDVRKGTTSVVPIKPIKRVGLQPLRDGFPYALTFTTG